MTNREIATDVADDHYAAAAGESKEALADRIEQALNRAKLEGQIESLEWVHSNGLDLSDSADDAILSAELDRLKAELAKERR